MTDPELVRAILAGRRELFADLVDRYENLVYTVIHSSLHGRADEAEDLAQEVFIKAYRALPGFRGEAAFSTWLHRITLNHLRDYLRRCRPVVVTLEALDDTAGAAAGRTPEDEVVAAEERLLLQQCLAEMPRDYRRVLLLYHYRGLTYAEIGRLLGLPARTVETRLYRAKRMLRARLEVPEQCVLG